MCNIIINQLVQQWCLIYVSIFKKESDSSSMDPTSFCVAYDDGTGLNIDFCDISPTSIPLSESEYPKVLRGNRDMLLTSIIHNSQPRATKDIDSDDIVPMTNEKKEQIERPENYSRDQKKMHPIKPPCSNCKKSCTANVNQSKREEINNYNQFWSMYRHRRRDFISRQVKSYQLPLKLLDVTQEDLTHYYGLWMRKRCAKSFSSAHLVTQMMKQFKWF
ncbi:hypothetical protein HHI36_005417 [Cryptolaemus montrouzieri]|uniref:Uncharacterized protein n=1 Tax=Cryptolaemus montrouzieri TaxID=559131 RepID=A0ABD2NU65_9CUCU